MATPKKIIVDVDVGTDDTVALLVLFQAEREGLVKIEAISCTDGNSTVENVCKNVVRVLELLERTDIPVYKGAEGSLIRLEGSRSYYHGIDGFGDLNYDENVDLSVLQSDPAAVGIYNLVAENPWEIFLICLGPLTNVALAMRLYPDLAGLIRGIFLMGGNYKAMGNISKAAEFNFYSDPEAAHIVLDSALQPVTILPWETCLRTKFSFDWRYNVLGVSDNPVVQLLNDAERSIYKDRTSENWIPCDAFIAAAFAYPACIEKVANFHATIELQGRETRGQVVIDHVRQRKPNVRMIKSINKEMFENILLVSAGSNVESKLIPV